MSREAYGGKPKRTNGREGGSKAKGRCEHSKTEGGHCCFTTSCADLRVSVLRVM